MKRTLLLLICLLSTTLVVFSKKQKNRPFTPEEVLTHLQSPEKKKVIIDTDTYNEMDDQYALAYAFGSDKMEILALYAAPFHNDRSSSFGDGMEKSYREIERIMDISGKTGKYPVFRGATERMSDNPDNYNTKNPAAEHLVKLARKAKDPIYVLVLGAITNVASALTIDPSIKEKIVVIWLGLHCIELNNMGEFNLDQDYRAGQIVMNSGVPFIVLPAAGTEGKGTGVLFVNQNDVKRSIKGDGRAAVFFRSKFPEEFFGSDAFWARVFWDLAAPGLIANPTAYKFNIIPAPVLTDSREFAFDSSRHKIIFMERLNPDVVKADAFKSISSLP